MTYINWTCPFCGRTNAADATHCPNCGTERTIQSTADTNASAASPVFTAYPSSSPAPKTSKSNEELLIVYAQVIKGFAILLCIGAAVGGIVSIAEDAAWMIALIIPYIMLLILPLLLLAAAIRVYCNMSLNLRSINENLQKIIHSKNL